VSERQKISFLQPRSCHCPCRDPAFSEQIILEKFNNLKVAKSPGPDSIQYCTNYDTV